MRITNMLAATALLIGAAAAPLAPAQAERGQDIAFYQAICDGVVAADPNANFGECMSFLFSADQGFFGAHLCDYLLELGVLENQGITFSECVRNFRQD